MKTDIVPKESYDAIELIISSAESVVDSAPKKLISSSSQGLLVGNRLGRLRVKRTSDQLKGLSFFLSPLAPDEGSPDHLIH